MIAPLAPSVLREIDVTLALLARKRFVQDPILGPRYSRVPSVAGSAQKRHGRIIEAALIASVRELGRYRVWREADFRVSAAADHLVLSQSESATWRSQLPYERRGRSIQIDMMVHDPAAETLGAYEVKRGNGHHDAGKVRSIKRDLLCTHVLLRSFAETHGFHVRECWSRIIFYYGMRSVPAPWSIAGHELDRHFGAPVLHRVEQANAYFQTRLFDFLDHEPIAEAATEQLTLFQPEAIA